MSWRTLDPQLRTRIQHTLTQRQLEVLILHLAGCSNRKGATMLGLTPTTYRDHLARAKHLTAHITTEDSA